MSVLGIYNTEITSPSSIYSTKMRLATRTSDGSAGSGDTASFSNAALSAMAARNDAFSSTSVSTTLGSTAVTFNNSTGAVKVGGTALNLSGFANTLKDDVVIKDNSGTIDVYNITTGKKATLDSSGKVDTSTITDYARRRGGPLCGDAQHPPRDCQ